MLKTVRIAIKSVHTLHEAHRAGQHQTSGVVQRTCVGSNIYWVWSHPIPSGKESVRWVMRKQLVTTVEMCHRIVFEIANQIKQSMYKN
jgi:hypothetical protein